LDGGWGSFAIGFRINTANGNYYGMGFNHGSNTVQWQFYNNWTTGLTGISDATANTLVVNNWIGVEVYSTGNSTVTYFWRWTNDPGDWDVTHTNWGTAAGGNVLFYEYNTDDPGTACDTGTRVGFFAYYPFTGTKFDSFYAGSSAS
jgi:hypothetical protein